MIFLNQLLTYIFLLLSVSVYGQGYQVALKSWNEHDGLSNRQVNGIYEDSRGFIWACTKNGLNCFDGYKFKVYNKDDDGFPFNYITSMTEDVEGSFWLLGSSRFNNNNLFIFDPLTKKVVSFKEKTGFRSDDRFNFLQKINDSTLFLGHITKPYFFTWHPRLGLHKIFYPVAVKEILTLSDTNTIWVQNNASELCEINISGKLLRKVKTRHVSVPSEPIVHNNAVYEWSVRYPHMLRLTTRVRIVNGMAELANFYSDFSDVIFNTGVDSVIYRGGKLFHPTKGLIRNFLEEGFSELKANLSQVILDRNGRIWMSNTYGLYMLTVTRNKFRKYFQQDMKTFNQNSFRNLLVKDHHLFAVNEFLGITRTNIDTSIKEGGLTSLWDLHLNYSLTQKSDGDIMGIQHCYAYTFDQKKRSWSLSLYPGGSVSFNIWKVLQVAKDSFLLGTSEGLKWYNSRLAAFSDFTKYNGYSELESTTILDILPGDNGQQWLCCNSGLYVYDKTVGVIGRFSSADTSKYFLPAMEFQHLYHDNKGLYWLATTAGLIKWDRPSGTSRLYSRKDGLSNDNIYAVYQDEKGYLWLSSDYGIMRFNKATGSVTSFLVQDGISHNEFNRVSHTMDSSGNIYFGTLNGVTAFNPLDFPDNIDDESRAPLAISMLEQFNGTTNHLDDKTSELVRTGTITLFPKDRFFRINFALLTYSDQIHATYYWRIDGIDSTWNSMREPVLSLSGLPYGKKMLHIKAQASDGSWGRNELHIQINIVKPLYLQAWFLTLSGLMLLASLYMLYEWRVFSFKRENERLERVVQVKTKALYETIGKLEISSKQKDILMKEIHHRVKNNLQIISTLLNLQLGKIKDENARGTIEEGISRISSIALIHHHLYKSDDMSVIDLSVFAGELFQQVSSVYKNAGLEINFINKMQHMSFDIDTALPMGLILNELLTNSFKYAFNNVTNGNIEVRLTASDNLFSMQYGDSGPGLQAGYDILENKSLGMVIIRSLSKQLGGGFRYIKDENNFVVDFKDSEERKRIE